VIVRAVKQTLGDVIFLVIQIGPEICHPLARLRNGLELTLSVSLAIFCLPCLADAHSTTKKGSASTAGAACAGRNAANISVQADCGNVFRVRGGLIPSPCHGWEDGSSVSLDKKFDMTSHKAPMRFVFPVSLLCNNQGCASDAITSRFAPPWKIPGIHKSM
jgi:hypothetical protein